MMTNPRSTLIISAIALILLLLVPAVSAEILYDEEIDDYVFTGESYVVPNAMPLASATTKVDKIVFKDISQCNSLSYIVIDCKPTHFVSAYPDGTHYLEYWFESNPEVTYPLKATITTSYNLLGQRTNIRIQLFFPEWDIGSLTGTQTIRFSDALYVSGAYDNNAVGKNYNAYVGGGKYDMLSAHTFTISSGKWTKNHITIEDNGYDYTINLKRVYGDQHFKSDLVAKLGETVRYSDSGSNDLELKFIHSEIDSVELSTLVKTRKYPLGGDQTDTSDSVTVYVKNSQTGALLADAHIVIQDTTTDPWTEVVNQTLPSGHGTFSLAKDPGLNLTQYRIGATVPGYQQVVPALFFRVTGPTNVVVEMEPLEGGPVNEDNTFLEFYVRDLNANGISNAQVFVDGKMRWTNAAGYTQFEVAKNASYPYSVSKSGYVTIEGTATVADGPRYVVNVVLGPKEIPTYTPDPGETPGGPGATPTPDRRTNEEKGQAVIDMIADNAEGIGALALICLLMGLLKLMAKW